MFLVHVTSSSCYQLNVELGMSTKKYRFVLGPVASLCNERFSTRVTMFIGGILSALGLLITAFATNLYILLLSFGLLSGKTKQL